MANVASEVKSGLQTRIAEEIERGERARAISQMIDHHTTEAHQEGGNAAMSFVREIQDEQARGIKHDGALMKQQQEVLRQLIRRDPHQDTSRQQVLAIVREDTNLKHLEGALQTTTEEIKGKADKAGEIRAKIAHHHDTHAQRPKHLKALFQKDHEHTLAALEDELRQHLGGHSTHP